MYVEKPWPSPATFANCTCCVIQPHVLKEGHVGSVIDAILECGLHISAMELFRLDRTSASEFFEVRFERPPLPTLLFVCFIALRWCRAPL